MWQMTRSNVKKIWLIAIICLSTVFLGCKEHTEINEISCKDYCETCVQCEECVNEFVNVKFDGNNGKLISGSENQYVKDLNDIIYPVYEKEMAIFQRFDKVKDENNEVIFKAIYHDLTIKDVSPFAITDDITFGFNYILGNDETSLDNDLSCDGKVLDMLSEKNINAIAIPSIFYKHCDENYIISDDYLKRIKNIVDEAYKRDFYVIICFYDSPDVRWGSLDYDNYDRYMNIIDVQVKQVAEYFIDYDEKLLLSFAAEPRDYGDYKYDKEAAMILNVANQRFVDVVRSTSYNNLYRNLIITPGESDYSDYGYKYFRMVDDEHIIARVHSYAPFGFTHEGSMDESSWTANEAAYKIELLSVMKTINENFIQKGIPVIMGEFGSRDKNNTLERAKWLEYYVSCAYAYGIKCFTWDAAKVHLDREYTFSLINRFDFTWAFPELTDKIEDLIKDNKYIPFYEETYNYVIGLDDEIIIPTEVTNLLTKEKEEVTINYNRDQLYEKDNKMYAKECGEIIFNYRLNSYFYYYRVVVVPSYELLASNFAFEIRENDSGYLQCYITTFGYSIMRVDYDWVSSNTDILTISKYSTISIMNDGVCAIIAINKETKEYGVVEVEIKDGKIIRFTSKVTE